MTDVLSCIVRFSDKFRCRFFPQLTDRPISADPACLVIYAIIDNAVAEGREDRKRCAFRQAMFGRSRIAERKLEKLTLASFLNDPHAPGRRADMCVEYFAEVSADAIIQVERIEKYVLQGCELAFVPPAFCVPFEVHSVVIQGFGPLLVGMDRMTAAIVLEVDYV